VIDRDDPGSAHRAYVAEETVPVAAIVGLVVGLAVFALGLDRWFGGDHRPADTWLVASLVVGAVFAVRNAVRRVIARRRYPLHIGPEDVVRTGVYRPPPDPRRTPRQRFVDRFSDDLDRSNEPPPPTRADRVAEVAGASLRRVSDLAAPLFPLVWVLPGFHAIDAALVGAWWSTLFFRRLLVRARSPRPPGATARGEM
jgi:hypothetical protein